MDVFIVLFLKIILFKIVPITFIASFKNYSVSRDILLYSPHFLTDY
jgi:hypothetical protein